MTIELAILAGVALALGLFVAVIFRVFRRVEQDDERISQLETKEYQQDARLDAHLKAIIQVKKDVHGLGQDVGWDDNRRVTKIMGTAATAELQAAAKKPDDEPPDDAA